MEKIVAAVVLASTLTAGQAQATEYANTLTREEVKTSIAGLAAVGRVCGDVQAARTVPVLIDDEQRERGLFSTEDWKQIQIGTVDTVIGMYAAGKGKACASVRAKAREPRITSPLSK